ncbi:MAG: DUF5666 domain-containing protein, partial [Gammaproteobacteria bacterium]|nr:DUF5666 domain-containing protein [Gammaproteobacteria bacterium]
PANLANGLYVEVKANAAPTGDITSGFVLAATKVEVEEDGDMDIDGDEGEELEVQGYITAVTASSFDFNGQTVAFSAVEFDDGFDSASLVVGMMVKVEGYIDASGHFIIKELEQEHGAELDAKGTVTSKGQDTVTIMLANSTSLTFSVTNDTRILDERDQGVVPVHYFSLADVQSGDYLEIDYYVDPASGLNTVTKLVREDQF